MYADFSLMQITLDVAYKLHNLTERGQKQATIMLTHLRREGKEEVKM